MKGFVCEMCLVGASGFEPPTPRSRTECSTRLSHAPTEETLFYLSAWSGRQPLVLVRELERFHASQRIVRGHVRLQRRHGDVSLADRVVVRVGVRIPVVLGLPDP